MNRGGLSRSFQDIEFDEHTRTMIFRELNARFGFPVKEWKKRFSEELGKKPRNQSAEEYFMHFGNTFINPVLNEILCRNRLHPTFNKFVEYVVRGRGE
ncbi:MAG TPA: hypothetical protein VIH22_12535 [Cyclobacteriaceae bacterium]|jgi:hypothetical protein